MSVYYNDNEPFVCAWMQNLMDAGLITQGVIDSRPIREVKADEVRHYTRAHWFAGIAGWDYALQLAGWPANRPVWTASLPCQPFSVAGRQKAERDDRHLWPVFYDLVRECRPVTIFGEQVEAAVRLGWIDRVRADLDRAGYAFGFVVLGAHSVGAPHIRQRIYWVADRQCVGVSRPSACVSVEKVAQQGASVRWPDSPSCFVDGEELRLVGSNDESILRPTSDGFPNVVDHIKAIGNSIVPQVAAEFIKAFLDIDAGR